MIFKAKLRKIGNSQGIYIPKNVITSYKIGDVITLNVITLEDNKPNVITSKKQNNPAPQASQVIEPQDKISAPDKYDNKGKFKTYFKKPIINQLNSPEAVKDWHKNKFNNKKKVKTFFK